MGSRIGSAEPWKEGPSAFRNPVDQLLGYLVGRDTKSALVLVVCSQDVSSVQNRVEQVISKHPRYKRRGPDVVGFPVYVLHHESDRAREIQVALVVVAIPAKQGEAAHQRGKENER